MISAAFGFDFLYRFITFFHSFYSRDVFLLLHWLFALGFSYRASSFCSSCSSTASSASSTAFESSFCSQIGSDYKSSGNKSVLKLCLGTKPAHFKLERFVFGWIPA